MSFFFKTFKAGNTNYDAAVAPVLFPGFDGLGLPGSVMGTIIPEDFGMRHFIPENPGSGERLRREGSSCEAVAGENVKLYSDKTIREQEMKLYRVEAPDAAGEN